MSLASDAGNPGWSKLVCCEAWWLHSNNPSYFRILVGSSFLDIYWKWLLSYVKRFSRFLYE